MKTKLTKAPARRRPRTMKTNAKAVNAKKVSASPALSKARPAKPAARRIAPAPDLHIEVGYLQRCAEAVEIAKLIRPLLKISGPTVFHGTRSPRTIIAEDVLVGGHPNYEVSLTRSLHTAIYWAGLERGELDETNGGAVLVLDRDRLGHRFSLNCYRDPCWDDYPVRRDRKSSEAEETIFGAIPNLHHYLIDVIWFDETTGAVRSRNHERDQRRNRSVQMNHSDGGHALGT